MEIIKIIIEIICGILLGALNIWIGICIERTRQAKKPLDRKYQEWKEGMEKRGAKIRETYWNDQQYDVAVKAIEAMSKPIEKTTEQ